jgi:hypothetical protein
MEVAKGRLMARIPQRHIRMPHTIDEPLALPSVPTVVCALIIYV